MQTGRFCQQRRQDGRWNPGGLYPTNYGGYATTGDAGQHETFATNRPAGCGGVQAAGSELRSGAAVITAGRTTNKQAVGNAASRLILEIDIRQLLSGAVDYDKARFQFGDQPGRREAAGGLITQIP